MRGEIDIHVVTINTEKKLRDARTRRAHARNQRDAPLTFRADEEAPFHTLMTLATALTRSLMRRTPALQQPPGHVTHAPIAPTDAVS